MCRELGEVIRIHFMRYIVYTHCIWAVERECCCGNTLTYW